jgi:hypothetical protein
MSTVLTKLRPPKKPRITVTGDLTIWIVSVDAHTSSYRVYRGPRSVAAVFAVMEAERRYGRRVHLELELPACSPTQFGLADLEALGLLR